MALVEQGAGAVHQAAVVELDILANALLIKAAEHRGRAGAVETLVVVKDPNSHECPFC
jgi:hypothetical protein